MSETIRGKGVISGIAVGTVMLAGQNLDGYLAAYHPGTLAEEESKAEAAIAAVTETLLTTIERLRKEDQAEQAAILEAHRMMVQDPMMADNIRSKIEACGSAPQGILDAANEQAQVFEQMEDEYFAARAVDLRDVGKRIAKYVLGVKEPEPGAGQLILCGEEIEPSVVAGMPTDQIAGVILGSGSATSHVVIIAKARAIPTVLGIGDKIELISDGDEVILDGRKNSPPTTPRSRISPPSQRTACALS